jgi:hypothetical protein
MVYIVPAHWTANQGNTGVIMGALMDLLQHGFLDAHPGLAGVAIGAVVLLTLTCLVRRFRTRQR